MTEEAWDLSKYRGFYMVGQKHGVFFGNFISPIGQPAKKYTNKFNKEPLSKAVHFFFFVKNKLNKNNEAEIA